MTAVIDFCFVVTLMFIGLWLENINGKHGFFDEFLTPLPLGLTGLAVLVERSWA